MAEGHGASRGSSDRGPGDAIPRSRSTKQASEPLLWILGPYPHGAQPCDLSAVPGSVHGQLSGLLCHSMSCLITFETFIFLSEQVRVGGGF